MVTVLIQADLMVGQAATAPPFSASLGTSEAGGLLQSPVPSLGDVYWTVSTTMSTETTAIEASAFLLVASGIKNFKL